MILVAILDRPGTVSIPSKYLPFFDLVEVARLSLLPWLDTPVSHPLRA